MRRTPHKGIIANPNCATIIGLVPTWPLHQLAGVTRMIVSTYQAASGARVPGMRELEEQIGCMGRGEEMPTPRAFAAQLASNLIPQIGGFDEGYFMYVEDADITQKARQRGLVYYLPQCTAYHAWHRAPNKSLKPFWMQLKSMGRYFCKWGFRLK